MARPVKEAVILSRTARVTRNGPSRFGGLQERIRKQRAHIEVEIAFLELLQPTLLAAADLVSRNIG